MHERRFRSLSYNECDVLAMSVYEMIGFASAARDLWEELEHEMHCRRHGTANLPEPAWEDRKRSVR